MGLFELALKIFLRRTKIVLNGLPDICWILQKSRWGFEATALVGALPHYAHDGAHDYDVIFHEPDVWCQSTASCRPASYCTLPRSVDYFHIHPVRFGTEIAVKPDGAFV